MAMPAQNAEWTAEMVRALPEDGKRYEVLDGELFVSPAPTYDHQRVVLALVRRLDPYVRTNRLGEVLVSPADIELSSRRYVQPDIFVIPLTPGKRPRVWREAGRLLLVAEVLSPSTARADRTNKRDIFQDERVPEYWIVDPDARVIERWRPDDERPEILSRLIDWRPSREVEPLQIDLPGFFAEALD
jgi:Uma2 family endonuclease